MHDLLRAALGRHAAVGNDGDFVGDLKGFAQFMRDHQAGGAQGVVQVADEARGGADGDWVQAREWFVIEDQFRIQSDGTGQGDATRHAARNLGGHQIARAAQANGFEFHEHDVMDHRFGQRAAFAQGKSDIFKDVDVLEQSAELKQHAHALARRIQRVLIHRANVLAVKQRLPLLRPALPADQAQHGGLAAAR